MKKYETIEGYIEDVLAGRDLSDYEGAFVHMESWITNPLNTPLFLFKFEEIEEMDDESGVPMLAKQRGLRELLVPPNLEDVILVQQEKDPQSSPEDYVNAINHYREYDSFLN